MNPFSGASAQPSETSDPVFQHINIDVVPIIAPPPMEFGQDESDSGKSKEDEPEPVEYNASASFGQPDSFDFRQPEEEAAVTIEECRDVTMMIINIPGMFGYDHLARDEQQCAPFAKELHKYCERKGLDPRDWFFDEFGMCLTGFGLLGGMYKDHREYKKEHPKGGKKQKIDVGSGIDDSYSRALPEPEEAPDARPEGANETEGIGLGGRGL